MVRRAASTLTAESQKENSGGANTSAVKAEKMNGSSKDRRARVESEDEEDEVLQQTQSGVYEDEEDEGLAEEANDAEGGGSPKGRKRARANTQGDARPLGETKGKAKAEPKTLPRDVDGYVFM